MLLAIALVSSCAASRVEAEATIELPPPLQWHFYQNSCPDVERYVRDQVEFYWKQDSTLAVKLIQLLYTDCFIKGCDASILLDGPDTEKTAPQNAPILGFPLEVIDKVKEVLEQHCPGVVSCPTLSTLPLEMLSSWREECRTPFRRGGGTEIRPVRSWWTSQCTPPRGKR